MFEQSSAEKEEFKVLKMRRRDIYKGKGDNRRTAVRERMCSGGWVYIHLLCAVKALITAQHTHCVLMRTQPCALSHSHSQILTMTSEEEWSENVNAYNQFMSLVL